MRHVGSRYASCSFFYLCQSPKYYEMNTIRCRLFSFLRCICPSSHGAKKWGKFFSLSFCHHYPLNELMLLVRGIVVFVEEIKQSLLRQDKLNFLKVRLFLSCDDAIVSFFYFVVADEQIY